MSNKKQAKPPKRFLRSDRGRIRCWISVLLFSLMIGTAVIVLGLLWLVSPAGLRWATPRIEALVADAVGTDVQMDGLRLSFPPRLSIDQFRVGEESNPYLDVHSLSIRLSARALMQRTVRVRSLAIDQVKYRSWPDQGETQNERETRSQWTGLPESIGPIRRVQVDAVEVKAIQWNDLLVHVLGELDINLDGDHASTEWIVGLSENAEEAAFTGTIQLLGQLRSSRSFVLPVMTIGIYCDELLLRDMPLRGLLMELESDGEQIAYTLQGEGKRPQSWQAGADGVIQLLDGTFSGFQLSAFSVEYGDLLVELLEPLLLDRQESEYRWEEMRLAIGEGSLVAEGEFGASAMDISAEIFDVPLSMFGFGGVSPAQGDFRGELKMQGDPASPEISLSLLFSDLMPANPEYWEGPPAEFRADFVLAEGRLSSHFELLGPAGKPGVIDLDTPFLLSLMPFYVEWPPQGDISGRMTAETDLSEVAQLFVLDVHRLRGLFRVDLSISGSMADPALSGIITVDDGQYEHDLLGTRLRDVSMAFSGERDQLRLDYFRANDGRGGALSMSGAVDFKTQEHYPFAGQLELDNFRLMQNDTMTATGNGRIAWEGNRLASQIRGVLSIGPAELSIPERLPAAMIDLDVIELDGDTPPDLDETPVGLQHAMSMDLQIVIPDRFFVRGRGLDSEWAGEIRARGPVTEPVLTGSLSVVRGRFVFFGRRLGLTRGIITLDGSVPPRPGLDVVAEARTRDMTAIMRLSGAVDAPNIELESAPILPQDEILARLLFGRNVDRITPFQALTIAQAVNQLRGAGSAFDVMGHTRRVLRVDQIELRDDDQDGEMTLAVGKYISDRIFVELERGSGDNGTRVAVEVELTPSLRLDSEIGTEAEAGIGLSWQWDF